MGPHRPHRPRRLRRKVPYLDVVAPVRRTTRSYHARLPTREQLARLDYTALLEVATDLVEQVREARGNLGSALLVDISGQTVRRCEQDAAGALVAGWRQWHREQE
ncbi:unnamed protein product, partial [Prorocentrum cordatum]